MFVKILYLPHYENLKLKDALTQSIKYTLPEVLTKYNRQVERWRALPITAVSLFLCMPSQKISNLRDGIAVRASRKVESISNYRYKLSSILARASGNGNMVSSFRLNVSLQIPDNKLLLGKNLLGNERGEVFNGFRLFSSKAELINVLYAENSIEYTFWSNVPAQIYFEDGKMKSIIEIYDIWGNKIDFLRSKMNNNKILLLEFEANGVYKIKAKL